MDYNIQKLIDPNWIGNILGLHFEPRREKRGVHRIGDKWLMWKRKEQSSQRLGEREAEFNVKEEKKEVNPDCTSRACNWSNHVLPLSNPY